MLVAGLPVSWFVCLCILMFVEIFYCAFTTEISNSAGIGSVLWFLLHELVLVDAFGHDTGA